MTMNLMGANWFNNVNKKCTVCHSEEIFTQKEIQELLAKSILQETHDCRGESMSRAGWLETRLGLESWSFWLMTPTRGWRTEITREPRLRPGTILKCTYKCCTYNIVAASSARWRLSHRKKRQDKWMPVVQAMKMTDPKEGPKIARKAPAHVEEVQKRQGIHKNSTLQVLRGWGYSWNRPISFWQSNHTKCKIQVPLF